MEAIINVQEKDSNSIQWASVSYQIAMIIPYTIVEIERHM